MSSRTWLISIFFSCYKGTITLSLSSAVVWANSSPMYLIDTYVAWAEQTELFYSGETTNIRVLLYTFCTEYHFKQIKSGTSVLNVSCSPMCSCFKNRSYTTGLFLSTFVYFNSCKYPFYIWISNEQLLTKSWKMRGILARQWVRCFLQLPHIWTCAEWVLTSRACDHAGAPVR